MKHIGFSHDHSEELKVLELKATPARKAILDFLESEDRPLDVVSIFEYLKKRKVNADIATVFRIINKFTDKGLTKKIEFKEGKFRYELFAKDEHHHLVCNNCGNIEDISDCNISSLEKDIEKKKKFKVRSHSLEFFGLCKDCQR
ncbi:MAG: Fur family transcriptional regulator [Patescibacteria group bacterium]